MKPILALAALATLAACGGGVHSIGVTRGCGLADQPWLGSQSGMPVRCKPQAQSPSNWQG